MATIALSQVKYDVINTWSQSFDDTLRKFTMPLTTDGAGSDVTLIDSTLGLGNMGLNDFDRRVVENITNSTTSGVDKDGFAEATGTVTMSPAVTVHASGNTYIFYPYNLAPRTLEEWVDRVLLSTYASHIWWPSLFADSDMETSSTETEYWTAISGATIAFDTDAPDVLFGTTSMSVTTNATGEGIFTSGSVGGTIPVTQREQVLVSTYVRTTAAGGAISVTLYDATNAAAIKTISGIDQQAWTEVRFQETAPDGCELIQLRYTSDTATAAAFHIGVPVIVRSLYRRWYTAPSWLDTDTQIEEAYYLHQPYVSEVADTYIAQASRLQRIPLPDSLQDSRAIHEFWLTRLEQSPRPYALKVQRPFTALTTNTSTTRCERWYLMWKVLSNICKAQSEPKWREYERNAQRIARRLHYGEKKVMLSENRKVLV